MRTQELTVTQAEEGRTLAAFLRERLILPSSQVRLLIEGGRVQLRSGPCRDLRFLVRTGQKLRIAAPKPAADQPKKRKAAPVVRFADAHVVVVDKPAGLTTMRHAREAEEFGEHGQRYLPPTLADLLPGLLPRDGGSTRVRAVHRLDRETSGLVVFARTADAERALGNQFRAHTVTRTYQALVRGQPQEATLETFLIDDRGDGRRGSTTTPGEGKRAVTHVRVLEDLDNFALVECRLETGRTHQVRIHLGEAGTPLCGERVYDRPLHGRPLPDTSGKGRPMLHAATLGFLHPATSKQVTWTSPMPDDMRELLERLRKCARLSSPQE